MQILINTCKNLPGPGGDADPMACNRNTASSLEKKLALSNAYS